MVRKRRVELDNKRKQWKYKMTINYVSLDRFSVFSVNDSLNPDFDNLTLVVCTLMHNDKAGSKEPM
jgi:hypothetical protein